MGTLPRLPDVDMLVSLHETVLERVGGASGIRSIDAIAGAWGRAATRLHYAPDTDIPVLAATLAVSIAKAHGFADGNKRTAYGAIAMTLAMNGYHLNAGPAETVEAIVAAAAGDGDPERLGAWLADHAAPDPVYRALFDYDLAGPSG